MSPKGIDYLLRSKFTLRMKAEILSYSRTRGIFAGVSLEGAVSPRSITD